jgi:sugar transferase (PEP-CTERM/EpsH1 system associated)
MKRTVIHLVYSLGYGGLEQVIVNLINHSQNYELKHIIISLTDEHDLYASIKPDVKIISIDKKSGTDISSHFKLFRLLRNIKPDIIQTYNFATIEYHLIAFISGVKLQIHSDHGRGGDDFYGKNKKNNLLRRFSALFLDHYFVVSEDLFEWVEKILKILPPKLKLIYNGVDTEVFHPAKSTPDGFTICTVGRLHEEKNQALLIDAFCLLKQENKALTEFRLVIAGDGPLHDDLKQKINQCPYTNDISLLGNQDDIPNLLRKSNLFVLTSVYEAMPMTILEAMACGLPVITTNVGGIRYLLSENEAWLVDQDIRQIVEAILFVYKHSDQSKAISLNGLQLVREKYSMKKMVRRYMEMYGVEAAVSSH